MSEQIEKLKDEALLAQFSLNKKLKITLSLTMSIQRQLSLLAERTGVPVERMERQFILKHLAGVEVDEDALNRAEALQNKALS